MKDYLGSSSSKMLSGSACRDPYWEELTEEQKIEVLSRRAESQDREIRDLRDLLGKLLKHTHSEEGLLVPIREALKDDCRDGKYPGQQGTGIFNREAK